jgi:vacuolar-type H+-ATPase subunit I/STV1
MLASLSHLLADWPIWLAVTLCLGAPAAFASGRALALTWRPFGKGVLYAAILAAVVGFLAYALFGVSVIPAGAIVERVVAEDALGAAVLGAGWAITFLSLLLVTFAGWRLTRAHQMRRQYPFLFAAEQR